MNKKRTTGPAVALLLVALLLLGGSVLAQELTWGQPVRSAAGYDLSWWTADGGGQTFSAGAGYSLGGAIGQPDAGQMAGSGYHLSGGFWSGATVVYNLYLPIIARSY